jgi:transcriptional regulator with XRE-family HTH domain
VTTFTTLSLGWWSENCNHYPRRRRRTIRDEQPCYSLVMPGLRPGAAVGQAVKALRTARGWSQETAAQWMREMGLPWQPYQLGDLESGRRQEVNLSELVVLAEVFGVALSDLLPGTGQIRIGDTERPSRLLAERLTGALPLTADLLGPTITPGITGPYWVRQGSRSSFMYPMAEVEAAMRLGLTIEEYRKRQAEENNAT